MQQKKRRQVRRCSHCLKVGHNLARCTERMTDSVPPITEKPAPLLTSSSQNPRTPTVRLFVHHTDSESANSPHIINLKPHRSTPWEKVESAAPEADNSVSTQSSPITEAVNAPLPTNTPVSTIAFTVKDTAPSLLSKINDWVIKRRYARTAETVFNIHSSSTEPIVPILTSLPDTEDRPSFIDTISRAHHALPLRRIGAIAGLIGILSTIPGPALGYYQDLQSTKNTLTTHSAEAFSALQESTQALKEADFVAAEAATERALTKFNTIFDLLDQNKGLQVIAGSIPGVGSTVRSRQHIIVAGQEITLANSYVLNGIRDSQSTDLKTLTERLNVILSAIRTALPNYQKAKTNLEQIDPETLPPEIQEKFASFRELFTSAVSDFETLSDAGSALQEIFGGNGTRRYLITFQNNHELRPTGGFMGSFAILEIKDGVITKLDIPPGGTYDLQGMLKKYIAPPEPLQLLKNRWEFQDVNWFPDFPTTADKILWFYRNSYGVTADGVIAVNATVLERLLTLIGPVSDSNRQLTLTADNVLTELQTVVEEGPEKKDNKPKQVIADLAPQLIEKTKSNSNILAILTNMLDAFSQKEIQVYFTDAQTQEVIKNFGWSGQIAQTNDTQDYLSVINTNIRGQKSDAKIKQHISHQSVIANDGSIINTVTITREHTGTPGEKMYGQTNIDYIRLYTPLGSQLIQAGGFTWPDEKVFKVPEDWYEKDPLIAEHEREAGYDNQSGTRITHEFGKTTFGNWVMTEPGTTSTITFTYRLPFRLDNFSSDNKVSLNTLFSAFKRELTRYELVVQKQSGITSSFESQIILPEGWSPFWKQGRNVRLAKNGANTPLFPLEHDTVLGVIAEKTLSP